MDKEIKLIPTAGALGNESRKRKRGKSKKGEKNESKQAKKLGKKGEKIKLKDKLVYAPPNAAYVPPVFDEAPIAPPVNLAGRPDGLLRSETGVKRYQMKALGPHHAGNLNTENFIHFRIRANKNEWIRFRSDSLSLTIFGQVLNTNYVPPERAAEHAAATAENKTQYHALLARAGNPRVALDPSVLATGFIQRVEASINHLPVPTNGAIGDFLIQFARCNKIYNHKAENYFALASQFSWDADALKSKVMQAATAPFDYNLYTSRTGVRIPAYLDGVFPLNLKTPMMEAVENKKQEKLYFPPDTVIDLKFHMHRSKIEAIFHHEVNMTKYFDKAQPVTAPTEMKFTFQDACLEYESIELHPANHVKVMEEFHNKGIAYYPYDIPRGQTQSLQPNATYTENNFTIQPYCRFIIVMFLQDWAAMVMDNTRRPLSGFSRFPPNASRIELSYAGESNLIMDSFENFGVKGEQHNVSQKMYWQYVQNLRLTNASFDDWFPKSSTETSLIQSFLVDTRSILSDKTETLTVKCRFAGGTQSPADLQVVCISIHPNGQAVVKSGPNNLSWAWQFLQGL